jgi:transposase
MDKHITGRTRRQHSAEFKQQVVDACSQPGASVAGVALAHNLNANLVRRWLAEHGVLPPSRRPAPLPATALEAEAFGFVPIRLDPADPPPRDIRIELRRGGSTVTIHWPLQAASDCGAWLQAWLK